MARDRHGDINSGGSTALKVLAPVLGLLAGTIAYRFSYDAVKSLFDAPPKATRTAPFEPTPQAQPNPYPRQSPRQTAPRQHPPQPGSSQEPPPPPRVEPTKPELAKLADVPPNPAPPFDVDPNAKAAGKGVYLAALQPFAYEGGPWPYAVGLTGSKAEAPIKVQSQEYKYGISAFPPNSTVASCRVSFAPGAEFRRLKGRGALNDYASNPWGKIAFTVWGDGKKLWESEPLDKSGSATGFDIDVTGVKVLTLETRVKAGSHLHAHAVWLDPWLER